jgi:hypothetical protein
MKGDLKREYIAMFEGGLSVKEIAEQTSGQPGNIARHLSDAGLRDSARLGMDRHRGRQWEIRCERGRRRLERLRLEIAVIEARMARTPDRQVQDRHNISAMIQREILERAGLTNSRPRRDDELKAAVLNAFSSRTADEVAAEFGVARRQIFKWAADAKREAASA